MRYHVLVCYDISEPKRWRKVFKIMKGMGDHIQYSVFLCQLTKKQKVELKYRLDQVIHHQQDQVMFVDIGTTTSDQLEKKITVLGRDYAPRDLRMLFF